MAVHGESNEFSKTTGVIVFDGFSVPKCLQDRVTTENF